ncbi:MAG: A/G-specific adenine glycosylase [bacterium]|nr:A/G-specific adenine glycosylase [bacterium]
MSDDVGRMRAFRRRVRAHYQAYGRSALPWRRTKNPYRIIVSEFMLQQTQALRVVPTYRAFLRRFPSVCALAAASRPDVLLAWQGLGYNRRALMLHETARRILAAHGGRVPDDSRALRALPGVGPYTAAAVRIFAFNRPDVCIETNIRSVFLYEFFPGVARVSDQRLLPLIQKALDRRNPRAWYEALMDYGSALKRDVPNPSRQSVGYVRTQKFAGSVRYARGRILALALQNRKRHDAAFSITAVAALASLASRTTVRTALEGLVRDGLLTKVRGKYQLAA